MTSDGFPALPFFRTRDSKRRAFGTFIRLRPRPSVLLSAGLRLLCVDVLLSVGGAQITLHGRAFVRWWGSEYFASMRLCLLAELRLFCVDVPLPIGGAQITLLGRAFVGWWCSYYFALMRLCLLAGLRLL